MPRTIAPVLLTEAGRAHLAAQCDRLRAELRDLAPLLQEAERDERHVRDYERILGEVTALEADLASSRLLPSRRRSDAVRRGDLVEVEFADGETFLVRPVHPLEAPIDEERISWDSPLGRVLIGAMPGDEVVVESPRGPWTCRVRRIVT